jgi:hypothetical protein
MGRPAGGCERASGCLWPLDDVHRGRARMYRFPVFGDGVRIIYPVTHLARSKWAEALRWFISSYTLLGRIKALLFTLVRRFEFELALPADEIIRNTAIVGRPVIASNPGAGPQLPLLIRLANTD